MTCASVCLSQQRGTEQAEEKSPGLGLPGAGAPCCGPPPRPRPPAPAAGTDSFFIHMWQCASDAVKTSLCFQSFLRRHVLEHFILRILQKSDCQMFTKNKASTPAGTNMPTLLGSEGDSFPRFPGVGTGAQVI